MEARSKRFARSFAAAIAVAAFTPTMASAEVAHVVQPGETLWSISAANNLTTRTVAVYNGLAEDSQVVEGQTVMVPTVDEGAAALAGAGVSEAPAATSAPVSSSTGGHTVVAGESLSSIAAANGLTVDELAAANGRSPDSFVYEGEALTIPAPSGAATTTSSTAGLGHIPSPYGELHLDPAAADSWNAMRQEALNGYGVDIHPGGPLSAYRTPEQQQELYDLYLSGQGAPAAPPGTSSHEVGLSVDLETPEMRSVVDAIGGGFGWGKLEAPDEWWHVSYGG
jgi:LysM repeat protein